MSGLINQYPLLGWLLFIAAFVLAGIPPFSGFVGKLLLLKGALTKEAILIVIIGLLTSLLILYSVMRIFIYAFWGAENKSFKKKSIKDFYEPIIFLLSLSIFLGIRSEEHTSELCS